MDQPTFLQQATIVRLPTLLAEVARGGIRIPRFQRTYAWGDRERLLLFDSIYRNIPIGSIIIWRTREHGLKTLASSGILIEPEEGTEKSSFNQYLLDGLQRLITLYTALGEGLSSISNAKSSDSSEVTREWEVFEQGMRPVFFDLESEEFELTPVHFQPPDTWLPLSILLDSYKLYEFREKLSALPDGRRLMNRVEKAADTFKNFNIPVVTVFSENLDAITESFQRINSSGQKLDLVNMVNALLWSPEFDVNDRIETIKSELAEVGWGDIEDSTILNVCKAALDLDLYNADAREIKEALLDNRHILDDAARPLKAMADFLARRCNILGPAVLPYRYQAVLLAEAIRIAGLDSPLARKDEDALASWLWVTTYSEYFAGINYGRLRKAVEHLRRVVDRGDAATPPDLTPEVRPWPRFDFRNARSRAILLRMAELDPRGPEGEDQDPFRVLAEHGKNAAPKLIPGTEIEDRTLAEGPENRIIADPRNIAPLRRILRDPETDSVILRSHGIDGRGEEMLRAGNLTGFLISRRDHLATVERLFVEDLGLSYES